MHHPDLAPPVTLRRGFLLPSQAATKGCAVALPLPAAADQSGASPLRRRRINSVLAPSQRHTGDPYRLTDALKREAPGGIQPGAEEALKVHRYFMTLKSSAARDARCGKKDRTRPGAGFELMREHYLSRPRFARRLLLPASNLT